MLVGTAGHVNHGKTSLVRALTGVDTDRLPEEKRRGLSIDLGFAYAETPDGSVIGFVDVPGHDRYLHNMISGVLPLDCVLLVVAADEGPARQTAEHLEILDLIGIGRLIAVVTRTDRADEATLAHTQGRLRQALERTSFAAANIFCVSSATGAGIDALTKHLHGLAVDRAPPGAGFRLPIDRVFTLPGIGIVVTGTILSGTVHIDDKLVLCPKGVAVRVRSLHAQDRPASCASAGVRCAVAIAGPRLEKDEIKRGEMLVAPALCEPAEHISVSLKPGDGVTLRNGRSLLLYHGTARTLARLTVLDGAGEAYLAELSPARPIAALYGDRILLRDEGAKINVAGGIVIDPYLPGREMARHMRSARLSAVLQRNHGDALAALLDAVGLVDFGRFCVARNLEPPEQQSLRGRFAENLIETGNDAIMLSRVLRAEAMTRLTDGLDRHHALHPEVLGPKAQEAIKFMGRQFAGDAARACLAEAVAQGLVVRDGACIRLTSHRPHLADEDERVWNRLREIFEEAKLRPPHIGALAETFALPFKEMERCLGRFETFGLLTRVARNRFFLPDTIDQFVAMANTLERDGKGEGFTAAEFAGMSGVGRNLSVEILEHLDRAGVTRRRGSRRRLA